MKLNYKRSLIFPIVTMIMGGLLNTSHATVTNITINDMTDTLSITGPGVYNCVNSTETCRSAGSAEFAFGTFFAGDPAIGTYKFNIWDSAAKTNLSDTLRFFIGFGGLGVIAVQDLEFFSDLDNGPALTPLTANGSDILPHPILDVIEDGTVQTALTVTSVNDMLNIQFQSDIESVPEPSTLALAVLGLFGLGLSRRGRAG